MTQSVLRTLLVTTALLLAPAALAHGQSWADADGVTAAVAKSEKTVIYKNLTLIDGTGAKPRPNMAVVITGEKIAAVLPVAALKVSDYGGNAEIIDSEGLYAVPGLIDSHVHMATDPDRRAAEAMMRRYLYSGITSVRDMAGDVRALAELQRASLMKEIPAPDLYYVALMAAPSFFHDPRTISSARGAIPGQVPWMQAITHDTDMPLAVAMSRGTNATAIKIYANLEGDLVKAITAEAHRQGFKVWAHGMVFPATPRDDVDAGVDVISHVCLLAYEASAAKPTHYHDRLQPDYANLKPDAPVFKDLFRDMAQKGIVLDATLRLYDVREKQLKKDPNPNFPYPCPVNFAAGLTRAAYDAGVAISTGTDGRTPVEDLYPALHEELVIMAEKVGLTPVEVIRASTQGGAKALGLDKLLGTIEPGKQADLVFVSKDPAKNISNLRSVVLTVKRGTAYPRADYKPITKDELPDSF
ncbi:amidohydrolase family protein [Govanella unica]|uniref:Amidohydrolase family protein n=1 Tax=Govanella unica TaxID=2975056 RepID=A0A9X3Z8H4_9PROT|nr:amidohydrolase family protein [Govania unica]MDA5195018.1 amidohydrolase family protein [Govania unica]